MISHPESQSKFQMFELVYGSHIGGKKGFTNIAVPYRANFAKNISTNI